MAKRRSNKRRKKRGSAKKAVTIIVILLIALIFGARDQLSGLFDPTENVTVDAPDAELIEEAVPEFDGDPYVTVNDNEPFFTEEEIQESEEKGSFEEYSRLDSYGRPGACMANVGEDLMPTDERGSISNVEPPGWHQVVYEDINGGENAYNRCHLIAYCLTGENDNRRNLITGTRYMNVDGMLPFEREAADYVEETGDHVLYRVTPIYEGDDLTANGVLMEAMSLESDDLQWCVYCYNEQPGLEIDHETGAAVHEYKEG